VEAATSRVVFHVSPLSGKGLLSQQVRDAIKALDKANGSAAIVKLRAFVAGTGDMRRVQSIVVEEFESKKWPLPAITTVQVGALPLEGAQVVIESVSQEKSKSVNPAGLAFLSAQEAETGAEAVARLEKALQAVGASALSVTCFANSLEQAESARAAAGRPFRGAAMVFVQLTRFSMKPFAACEGVGRLAQPGDGVQRMDLPGFDIADGRAHAVLVRRPSVVFTGSQTAFLEQPADIELAYGRLRKTIEAAGTGYDQIVLSRVYSLTGTPDAFAKEQRPARTSQVVEGLPSLDATMAIEVIATR
jgi:enamine deaminase RidA (YjgF/YER057c/UK114 family)